MNILKSLGNAVKSNTAGAISAGLMDAMDRRRAIGMLNQQRQQSQAEREFASAVNAKILSGDVDGAVQLMQQYGGRVSPRAVSDATEMIQQARLKQSQDRRQSDMEGQQKGNIAFMSEAMSKGAAPEEAQFLLNASKGGTRSFLDAAGAMHRMRNEAKEAKEKSDLKKQMESMGRWMNLGGGKVFNPATKEFASFDTAGGNADTGGVSDMVVQAILDDPSLFSQLSTADRLPLVPKLKAKGFDFSRPLSDTAIGRNADYKSALIELEKLRTELRKPENIDILGPIMGRAEVLIPGSKAQILQAKIDLVRQRVGKALEGGVLRKEDEEKYKRILPTVSDKPNVAMAKIDNLIKTIQSDQQLYMREQGEQNRGMGAGEMGRTPQSPPVDWTTASDQEIAQKAMEGDEAAVQEFRRRKQAGKFQAQTTP